MASAPLLSKFRSLRFLMFMAAGSDADFEPGIVKHLHDACPTLRTIILPKGGVSFWRDGKWLSSDDVCGDCTCSEGCRQASRDQL